MKCPKCHHEFSARARRAAPPPTMILPAGETLLSACESCARPFTQGETCAFHSHSAAVLCMDCYRTQKLPAVSWLDALTSDREGWIFGAHR